jgi:predicted nucleic acid-binding protein
MLQEAALRRGPALDVASSTVSETIFVLRGKNYEFDRVRIVAFLEGLLALPVRIVERPIIERAVGLYRDVHSDWDDCLLAACALERSNGRLVSFDRGLDRIPGLTRIEPTLPAAEGEA